MKVFFFEKRTAITLSVEAETEDEARERIEDEGLATFEHGDFVSEIVLVGVSTK
jgi:hypothetical protein